MFFFSPKQDKYEDASPRRENYDHVDTMKWGQPFNSLEDFQRDLIDIFMLPLNCLARSCVLAWDALCELGLILINLMTFSSEAGEHFTKMYTALILSFTELVSCCIVLFQEPLYFSVRCSITVGVGVYNLAGAIANLFSSSRTKTDNTYNQSIPTVFP